MTRRPPSHGPRGERGEFTLMGLLIATSIFLVVMGATLDVFSNAEKLNVTVNTRSDTDDEARRSLDLLSSQLRNLASPTPQKPEAVDLASPYDIIFQTVSPNGPNSGTNDTNVERVRYCLGDDGDLYRQEQTWTSQTVPDVPDASACPSTATASGEWSTATVLAQHITNRYDGQDRQLFSFNAPADTPSAITAIHAQLYVDQDPTHPPAETLISTGVFLRNQNRAPSAGFTADTSVTGKIVLNGSLSSDPEGDELTYVWWENTATPTCSTPPCKIGDGIRYDYSVARGSTHAIQLKVFDPSKLEGDSAVQTVVVP